MRKKLIIVAVVIIVVVTSGVWIPFVTFPLHLAAAYGDHTYGWPKEVTKVEGPLCGGPCMPGSVHRYFKKDCWGVILSEDVFDAPPTRYCIGVIGDEWEETDRNGQRLTQH